MSAWEALKSAALGEAGTAGEEDLQTATAARAVAVCCKVGESTAICFAFARLAAAMVDFFGGCAADLEANIGKFLGAALSSCFCPLTSRVS